MNLEKIIGSGKKFLKRVALASAITAASLGITACPVIPPPEPPPENKLSENTIILTEEQTAEISYIDKDTIVFSETPDFSPGEILVSDKTSQIPEGLFREVINVVGNTVYTEQANFEDAIENVSFSTERMISVRDSIYVEIPLVDFNSSVSVTDSENDVSVEGNIDIKSDFIFEMDIDDHHLNKLVFKNVIDENSDLSITAFSSLGEIIDEKFHPLPPYYFAPFTIWLPTTPLAFPVVITPKLDLIVGLKGGISPLTAQASQSFHSELGVKYENDSWDIIQSMDSDFETNMQFANEVNFKAYLGPKLDFLIYGGPGPYAQLDGYLELKVDTVNPAVELYGGLEAILGVSMEVFSKTLFDFSTNLLDFNWLIHRWEGAGNHPPELGPSVFIHINEGQQLYYQINGFDPDGDPITYSFLGSGGSYSWYSINPSTGIVIGTAPQVTADTPYGTFIKGDDGKGGTDLLGFTAWADDTSSNSQTVTIPLGSDGKDAYVSRFYDGTTNNYSSYNTETLEVVNDTPYPNIFLRESLLQFPLSLIPSNSTITSAKLKLYGNANDLDIKAREINNSWNESTVTWNTINHNGADIANTRVQTTNWYEWDITSLVQDWYSNPSQNYGLSLYTTDSTYLGARGEFKSSEYTADLSKRPKLEITYY